MASYKWPPKLDDESVYEAWKRDIGIWCELTDLPKKKQALAIHLSLTGRARVASSELDPDVLKQEDGVEQLLVKLDGLFLVDKGRRQFVAFHELYNYRRASDTNIREYVAAFEHVYFNFTKQGMDLPDSVMAFMLLASGSLSDSEQQLVMSAISEVTYANMKSALTRIFAGEIGGPSKTSAAVSTVVVKSEPVLLGNESKETYTKQQQAVQPIDTATAGDEVFYVKGRGRARVRGGGGAYRGGRSATTHTHAATRSASGRRQNPAGPDGKITKCLICGSRFHWARSCPDAYENDSVDKQQDSETVHLSLFMGYAGEEVNSGKLQTLVDEAKGCAVLDTGCSRSVCGEKWFNSYVSELSDYEREAIVEEKSSSTFTFADNVTVPSLRRVTLPCRIGNTSGTIVTDVVSCNIPLLLSKRSMKKAKMLLNFDTDQVKVCGDIIDLNSSSSGHYLLPISL